MMKPSLADRVLYVIERSNIPVPTDVLVRMAEANGYTKNTRAQVWAQLRLLQQFGYIRPQKKGRGPYANRWEPTARRAYA